MNNNVSRIVRDEVSFMLSRQGYNQVTHMESNGQKAALVIMPTVEARRLYWELKRVLDIEEPS